MLTLRALVGGRTWPRYVRGFGSLETLLGSWTMAKGGIAAIWAAAKKLPNLAGVEQQSGVQRRVETSEEPDTQAVKGVHMRSIMQ